MTFTCIIFTHVICLLKTRLIKKMCVLIPLSYDNHTDLSLVITTCFIILPRDTCYLKQYIKNIISFFVKIKVEKKCLEKSSIFMRVSDLLNYICSTMVV